MKEVDENGPLNTFACSRCQRQVTAATGWSGGLVEPAGLAVIITGGGEAVRVPTWREHACPGTPPMGWLPLVQVSNSDLKAAAWEIALPRPCPKCIVGPGQECVNLSFKKTIRYTAWPHVERYPEGYDPMDADQHQQVTKPWLGCPWHGEGTHIVDYVEANRMGQRCTQCDTTMNLRAK